MKNERKPRSRAAYQAERRKHSILVTFKDQAEKASFEADAEAAGYASFNAYLLQLLHNATSGVLYPPDYVEGLRSEVEKLRAWLDQAREENVDLRRDLKALQANEMNLGWILNDVPDGKEILERYRQRTRAPGVVP